MTLKKYLYAALAVVSAIALAACSDDEGTDPGHDSAPVVTIYEYAAPEDYDADITENIRIVPNDKVSKMFVYTELQTDKEAYVAEKGEAAYMDRVVSEGTEYAGEIQEVVISDLTGTYATTVVAVASNGARRAYENIFKGVTWVEGGTAFVQENVAGLSGTVTVQRQSDANIFRIVGLYTQLDSSLGDPDERFVFNFNDEKVCTQFSTTNAPFFVVNLQKEDGIYHGYYDAANYGDYCNVATGKLDENPAVAVSCLILNNSTGSLFTGGQIIVLINDFKWIE